MKNSILPVLLCSAFILGTISCKKNNDEPAPLPIADNSLPSGAVLSIKLLEKTTTSLQYAMDVAVFRDSKNMETQLGAANFSIDTLIQSAAKYYFSYSAINLAGGGAAKSYSALMLMDQSGSISTTDPLNYRLQAAKAFCGNLSLSDKVMLWSFAGSTAIPYGTAFSADSAQLIAAIESLRGKQAGSTPLYNSQFSVTNYCAANAPSEGKAIMTFTDGENTESGNSSAQVISNAIAKKVQLFNVGLGAAQAEELCRQSAATGGAFMFASNARQLISMFGNLGKLLNNTGRYYHTIWRITRNSGSFSSGTISQNLRVSLPYGGQVLIPFSLDY